MEPGTIRALAEAFSAFQRLIGDNHRPGFVLIGGYALQFHGLNRVTRDIDYSISPESFQHFAEVAASDPRFIHNKAAATWTYYCSDAANTDLTVEFDFVDLPAMLGIEGIEGRRLHGAGQVATLQELAVLKAISFFERQAAKDGGDLLWILEKMESDGLSFDDFDEDDMRREAFDDVQDVIHYINDNEAAAELRRLLEVFS
jgi:hypothetical protein